MKHLKYETLGGRVYLTSWFETAPPYIMARKAWWDSWWFRAMVEAACVLLGGSGTESLGQKWSQDQSPTPQTIIPLAITQLVEDPSFPNNSATPGTFHFQILTTGIKQYDCLTSHHESFHQSPF